MSSLIIKDATELAIGDRILVDQHGTIHTVDDATKLDQYGGCTIFTDQSTIFTGLPCPVKVVAS